MQLYDVGVVKSPLNFEFPFHLGEEIKFLEHVLENDFQCNWGVGVLLYGFEDLSKLATSYGLNATKIAHCPAFLLLLSLFFADHSKNYS